MILSASNTNSSALSRRQQAPSDEDERVFRRLNNIKQSPRTEVTTSIKNSPRKDERTSMGKSSGTRRSSSSSPPLSSKRRLSPKVGFSYGLSPIFELDNDNDMINNDKKGTNNSTNNSYHNRWEDSLSSSSSSSAPSAPIRKTKSFDDATSHLQGRKRGDAPPQPKRRMSSPYGQMRKRL